jgi:hypothetical protein
MSRLSRKPISTPSAGALRQGGGGALVVCRHSGAYGGPVAAVLLNRDPDRVGDAIDSTISEGYSCHVEALTGEARDPRDVKRNMGLALRVETPLEALERPLAGGASSPSSLGSGCRSTPEPGAARAARVPAGRGSCPTGARRRSANESWSRPPWYRRAAPPGRSGPRPRRSG